MFPQNIVINVNPCKETKNFQNNPNQNQDKLQNQQNFGHNGFENYQNYTYGMHGPDFSNSYLNKQVFNRNYQNNDNANGQTCSKINNNLISNRNIFPNIPTIIQIENDFNQPLPVLPGNIVFN